MARSPEHIRDGLMVALPVALVVAAAALMHRDRDPAAVAAAQEARAREFEGRPESDDEGFERLIAQKVIGDVPGDFHAWSNPSFQFYHDLSDDELRELRRDPGRVVDRLLKSISGPGESSRREKVLRSLGIYLDEVDGREPVKWFVHEGAAMLASGALPVAPEAHLAWAVASRSQSVGMEPSDREAFRKRARIVLNSPLPHPDYAKIWALGLAQLGGPEAREIVLGAWDRLDGNGRSILLETRFVGPQVP